MKISVITINYNNRDGLERTIKSVVSQTYKDFEYIIIDGNSSDGSKDVFNTYKERYDIKGVSEPDHGLYNAMNKGIDMAQGDYCVFMNSGDSFFDTEVLDKVSLHLKNNIGIVSGIGKAGILTWYPPEPSKINLTFFLKNSLNHQSTFVRRDILLRHHFSENYKIVSDTELLFKALILDNESYTDIPIIVCSCEDPGASGNLKKSLTERYFAIKKLLPPRMSYDIDFIVKYHNPAILKIGNLLYNRVFREISQTLKSKRVKK